MAQKSLPITPGQKYKFIVKSAEEAAAIIRDKLGETAQVISVRQVEGEGLARFLKSPKLEIIAQVPLAPSENSEAKNAAEAQSESADSGEESESPQRRKASRSRKTRVTLPQSYPAGRLIMFPRHWFVQCSTISPRAGCGRFCRRRVFQRNFLLRSASSLRPAV